MRTSLPYSSSESNLNFSNAIIKKHRLSFVSQNPKDQNQALQSHNDLTSLINGALQYCKNGSLSHQGSVANLNFLGIQGQRINQKVDNQETGGTQSSMVAQQLTSFKDARFERKMSKNREFSDNGRQELSSDLNVISKCKSNSNINFPSIQIHDLRQMRAQVKLFKQNEQKLTSTQNDQQQIRCFNNGSNSARNFFQDKRQSMDNQMLPLSPFIKSRQTYQNRYSNESTTSIAKDNDIMQIYSYRKSSFMNDKVAINRQSFQPNKSDSLKNSNLLSVESLSNFVLLAKKSSLSNLTKIQEVTAASQNLKGSQSFRVNPIPATRFISNQNLQKGGVVLDLAPPRSKFSLNQQPTTISVRLEDSILIPSKSNEVESNLSTQKTQHHHQQKILLSPTNSKMPKPQTSFESPSATLAMRQLFQESQLRIGKRKDQNQSSNPQQQQSMRNLQNSSDDFTTTQNNLISQKSSRNVPMINNSSHLFSPSQVNNNHKSRNQTIDKSLSTSNMYPNKTYNNQIISEEFKIQSQKQTKITVKLNDIIEEMSNAECNRNYQLKQQHADHQPMTSRNNNDNHVLQSQAASFQKLKILNPQNLTSTQTTHPTKHVSNKSKKFLKLNNTSTNQSPKNFKLSQTQTHQQFNTRNHHPGGKVTNFSFDKVLFKEEGQLKIKVHIDQTDSRRMSKNQSSTQNKSKVSNLVHNMKQATVSKVESKKLFVLSPSSSQVTMLPQPKASLNQVLQSINSNNQVRINKRLSNEKSLASLNFKIAPQGKVVNDENAQDIKVVESVDKIKAIEIKKPLYDLKTIQNYKAPLLKSTHQSNKAKQQKGWPFQRIANTKAKKDKAIANSTIAKPIAHQSSTQQNVILDQSQLQNQQPSKKHNFVDKSSLVQKAYSITPDTTQFFYENNDNNQILSSNQPSTISLAAAVDDHTIRLSEVSQLSCQSNGYYLGQQKRNSIHEIENILFFEQQKQQRIEQL